MAQQYNKTLFSDTNTDTDTNTWSISQYRNPSCVVFFKNYYFFFTEALHSEIFFYTKLLFILNCNI